MSFPGCRYIFFMSLTFQWLDKNPMIPAFYYSILHKYFKETCLPQGWAWPSSCSYIHSLSFTLAFLVLSSLISQYHIFSPFYGTSSLMVLVLEQIQAVRCTGLGDEYIRNLHTLNLSLLQSGLHCTFLGFSPSFDSGKDITQQLLQQIGYAIDKTVKVYLY